VTASIAWPDSIVEMEREVDNQVAAPAETRTPNWHRAHETLSKECGWKGGDSHCATGLWGTRDRAQPSSTGRATFLPSGMVAERSSPSRVRCAAQNAPLTAPGRSAKPSA